MSSLLAVALDMAFPGESWAKITIRNRPDTTATDVLDEESIEVDADGDTIILPGHRHIRIGGPPDIDIDATSNDVVRIGEDIHIEADETVMGDVVSVGGSIEVEGQVMGDCVSVGGDVVLREDASIAGSAVSIGGTIHKEKGARVMGDTVGMGFVPGFLFKLPFFTKTGRLFLKVIWIGMIFILAILSLLLFRSRIAAAADYASLHPGKSLLFGLIWMAAFLPLFILLLITVIGIPIAILLLVAFPIACFFGYVASGIVVGRKVTGTGLGTAGIAAMLLGLLLLESLGILGKTLDLLGGSFWLIGMFLSIVGWAVALTAVSIGLGAITAIRFRPFLTPPVPAMAGGGFTTPGAETGGMGSAPLAPSGQSAFSTPPYEPPPPYTPPYTPPPEAPSGTGGTGGSGSPSGEGSGLA